VKHFSRLVSGAVACVVVAGATFVAADEATAAPVPAHSAAVTQSVAASVSLAGAFVIALYTDFLNRQPSPSDISYWSAKLSQGSPRSVIADGFADSDEFRMIRMTHAYQTVLGRGVDPSGAASWLDAMHRGLITTDGIEKALYDSDEFYNDAAARNHANPNDGALIDDLYASILGREVSGTEGFDWLNAEFGAEFRQNPMNPSAAYGRQWLIDQVYDSTEASRGRVATIYNQFLGRAADEGGLESWASFDLAYGDAAVRAGFTTSDEYYQRASVRFS
jgi:hypothetical protein